MGMNEDSRRHYIPRVGLTQRCSADTVVVFGAGRGAGVVHGSPASFWYPAQHPSFDDLPAHGLHSAIPFSPRQRRKFLHGS